MSTLIRWYGQSAFLIEADRSVFVDPFGDLGSAEFRYPPVANVDADLLLVTHEHRDHNAVEAVGGDPVVIRSTAGRLDSPLGEVVAVASEHDEVAGTARGPNSIMCFSLGGLRFCHLGDLGQAALRPEQVEAIGAVDVLFVPAGGGPTIGGERAADVVRTLVPRLVVPMHFRTEAIGFLDPPDAFLEALGAPVLRLETNELVVEEALASGELVALLGPPV
ncbi:MAG TPA: MBL fold metallo-hydrolase [Gaiellaceae bacterium]|nr:MBL fold metallo-hydrolase [Gaiellaceae bacterium]